MNQTEIEHKKALFQYWQVVAGGLLSGAVFLLNLADKICRDSLLKWILMGFLAMALILIFKGIWNAPVMHKRMDKVLCCAGCLLIYAFFARYIYTKPCKEDQIKVNSSKSYTGQYAGATIQKTEIDNHKTFYRPIERTLRESDLKLITDSLVVKDKRILVQYLESRSEDTLFCSQLIKAMEEHGYYDIHRSPASKLTDHLSLGRITLLITSNQDFVIINPQ